jgi:dethiobiotin synthetase
MKIFITGIDTNIGKTIASAIFVKALQADYYKPIQCGDLEKSDSKIIAYLTGQNTHSEQFTLKAALSPNLAAADEGQNIELEDLTLPETDNHLIVEGAGGPLVPLNNQQYVIDIARRFNLPAILVTRNYLGCFNHTLLAVEAMENRGIKIKGLVFNGPKNPRYEEFLSQRTGLEKLLHIEQENNLTPQTIEKYSTQLKPRIKQWI